MTTSSSSVKSRKPPDAVSRPGAAVSRHQHVEDPVQSTSLGYEVPGSYLNVTEVSAVPAAQDRNELSRLDSHSIEEIASHQQTNERLPPGREPLSERQHSPPRQLAGARAGLVISNWATELYTVSYLILFAIFGTLARLGLQALTFYPGAPIAFSSVWPNFAGSLIIGFLIEDRMLFRFEWGTPTYDQHLTKAEMGRDSGSPRSQSASEDLATAKRAHLATKKTIPLYIGLATGFCGSFTSFSSFIRDVFLALSNDLPMPDGTATPRNGGYSFLALLAVALGTISLSFSGYYLGSQLAVALETVTPSIPYTLMRRIIDPLAVVLGWGSWIGAVILSIAPPDRFIDPGVSEFWRGRATLALSFAPLGCLARFYASARLNGRLASFPLGTFAVNMLGTAILGLAWDLAHVPEGGVIGCQVFQGIEDGFCGCLTTVSTWVTELAVLKRRKAYVYGSVSVFSAFALMVAIMGGLRWGRGFSGLLCLY